MPATKSRQFRLSDATLAKLDELARRLSPVPLTRTQVLTLAVDRLHESQPAKTKGKKS